MIEKKFSECLLNVVMYGTLDILKSVFLYRINLMRAGFAASRFHQSDKKLVQKCLDKLMGSFNVNDNYTIPTHIGREVVKHVKNEYRSNCS